MHSISPRFAIGSITLLIGLTILFFGGMFPLAQGVLPAVCALSAALTIPYFRVNLKNYNNILLQLGVFLPLGCVLIYGFIQVLPLGESFANTYWAFIGAGQGLGSISISPGLTVSHTIYLAGLILFAWTIYALGANHALTILKIISIVITLACVYGLIQFSMGNKFVLWVPKSSYITSLTGTFINRNTFATLAGLGVLANIAIMLHRVGEISSRLNTRQRFKAFWYLVLRPGWGWMALSCLCFIALLLTSSRAGITASLCGIMVLMGCLAGMRDPIRLPLIAVMGLFTVFTIFMLSALGGDFGQRFLTVSDDAALRHGINSGSAELVQQFWLTGTGFGTYGNAFFTAHSPEFLSHIYRVIDRAHNTFMELAVELGIPAMLLLCVSGVALLAAYFMGLKTRRRAIMWPALGISVLVLTGGHAFADFSLSAPAVALVTITMLMVAFAHALPLADTPTSAPSKPVGIAIAIMCAMVFAASVWLTVSNYHHFMASGTLRQLNNLEDVGPGPIHVAQRHILKCIKINPWHADCRTDLAQINMSLATGYGVTGNRAAIGLVYLNMAKESYLKALAIAPVNPHAWYRLARIEAFLGNADQASDYLVNSILTGPAEPVLSMQRIPFMLNLLPTSTPDNASLFTSNIWAHWQFSPDQMGIEMRKNPYVHANLAALLSNNTETLEKWRRYIRKPFPSSTPLGDSSENR